MSIPIRNLQFTIYNHVYVVAIRTSMPSITARRFASSQRGTGARDIAALCRPAPRVAAAATAELSRAELCAKRDRLSRAGDRCDTLARLCRSRARRARDGSARAGVSRSEEHTSE